MDPMQFFSAANDLGFGGGALSDQVGDETEEMRRKRVEQMQRSQMMGPDQSQAVKSIFGLSNAGY